MMEPLPKKLSSGIFNHISDEDLNTLMNDLDIMKYYENNFDYGRKYSRNDIARVLRKRLETFGLPYFNQTNLSLDINSRSVMKALQIRPKCFDELSQKSTLDRLYEAVYQESLARDELIF